MFKAILKTIFVILVISNPFITQSQGLQPGFIKNEYKELMYISARTCGASPEYYNQFPEPSHFKMLYRSQPIGLDNLWDLWVSEDKIAVISIRGTTQNAESWLANLYAAMVPAKGVLHLNSQDSFVYNLAAHHHAAVHVGWLLSTAYLSKEVVPKIEELYKQGFKDFIVTGHSQGGAISYLLYSLQDDHTLPMDIRFKTYCSAAPKPGNLYYAYEYEAKTQGVWAFNVVNAADWVPEVPMSIQTVTDFNDINPFNNAEMMINKEKFLKRLALKHVYKQLSKPAIKAQKNYENYLGKMTSKIIRQKVEGFIPPEYYKSNHYVRTGRTIVLFPDEAYYKIYPNDEKQTFNKPYLMLLEQLSDSIK